MNEAVRFLASSDTAAALMRAILHSTWIFTLIALGVYILFREMPKLSSDLKHKTALGAAIAFFVSFAGLFFYFYTGLQDANPIFSTTENTLLPQIVVFPPADSLTGMSSLFDHRIVILIWISGVLVFGLRNILSWIYLYFVVLSKEGEFYPALQSVGQHTTSKFGLEHKVRIKAVRFHGSPFTTGWLRPVIYFPIGLINQLSLQETEAIIAHELAHIVRRDYLTNIFLQLINTLFYYHPAVWWILAVVREERENICDEMAIAVNGNRFEYSRTLIKVHEWQYPSTLQPNLAFNQSQYFSNRIKKILNMDTNRNYFTGKIVGAGLILAGILFFTIHLTGNHKSGAEKENYSFLTEPEFSNDSIPGVRKENIFIKKKTDDKDVEVTFENGEVKELKVDGKKIDAQDYDKYQDLIADLKPDRKGSGSFYFFDSDNGKGGFRFNFRNFGEGDSLFGRDFVFPFNSEGQDMNQHRLNMEEHRKMMEELRKQMESMKFDFKFDFDEMPKWDMKEFSMPQLDEWLNKLEKDGMHFRFSPRGKDQDGFEYFEDFDFETPNSSKDVNEILGDALNKDGFLLPGKMNKVELTGKHLKINGEKQPANIYNKYRRIVEEVLGAELNKNSKLEFSIMGKESKRKYRVF
jgi:beta-lactamase regulating signal transducer with metallopeptidase domain